MAHSVIAYALRLLHNQRLEVIRTRSPFREDQSQKSSRAAKTSCGRHAH